MLKITKKMPAIRTIVEINLECDHANCWHESKTLIAYLTTWPLPLRTILLE